MRKQLWNILAGLTVGLPLISGCARHRYDAGHASEVPVGGGFVLNWQAPLDLDSKDELSKLFLRDDLLVAYTKRNYVYSMGASGGTVKWTQLIAPTGQAVQPPVMLKDKMAIPTGSRIELFDGAGMRLKSVPIGHALRSPLNGDGKLIYGGLDFSHGGRFAQIDVDRPVNNVRWEVITTLGVTSMPVVFQKTIYIASEGGEVYAVNDEKAAVWGLAGGYFKTDGAVVADLAVDDYGVYVASTDGKLYCLDRATGKVKWRYFAEKFLLDAPAVTAESVYQIVRERGVVAIDKTGGTLVRQARWIARDATQFLSEDAQFAYLRWADNSIVAVDKKTGEQKFKSRRHDLSVFVTNTKDSMIYAGASEGTILAIKPVTHAGTVGQLVMGDERFEWVAMGG